MVRGAQLRVQWLDELAARRCQALTVRAEQEAMLAETAKRALTPPEPDGTPLTVRWSCTKPTDAAGEVLHTQVMAFRREELVPGFGDLLQMWLEKR